MALSRVEVGQYLESPVYRFRASDARVALARLVILLLLSETELVGAVIAFNVVEDDMKELSPYSRLMQSDD